MRAVSPHAGVGESFMPDVPYSAHAGNPQILGQKPITYFRQILSLCEYPQVSTATRPTCMSIIDLVFPHMVPCLNIHHVHVMTHEGGGQCAHHK